MLEQGLDLIRSNWDALRWLIGLWLAGLVSVWALIGAMTCVVLFMRRRPDPRPVASTALQLLQTRLARGEISPLDYHATLNTLRNSGTTTRNRNRSAQRQHSGVPLTRTEPALASPPDALSTFLQRLSTIGIAVLCVVVVAFLALLADRLAPAGSIGSSSLLVIFLTGLTTGGLTCLAVQGGLLATTVAQREQSALRGSEALAGRAAPIVMFLAAKLIAYTLLGALLGLFGAAIGLTPTVQGWLQIALGLFMLGVAGQLLNLHPVFRFFSLQPPKWVQRMIRQESRSGSLLAPALLGGLTVFIPCATTQAMMIAAIGTGSPVGGALTMFAFTLGTIPLFFSLGYLATQLGAAMRSVFVRVAAVAILVLALFSVTGGLALLGAPIPELAFPGTRPATDSGSPSVAPAAPAPNTPAPAQSSTVQEVVLRAEPTAYVPNQIQFKVGTPARLKLVTGSQLGCTSSFLIPALKVQKILAKNSEVLIDIPTDKPQRIGFTCSMGMYRGVIDVVE